MKLSFLRDDVRLVTINHDLSFRGDLAVKLARVELHLDVECFFAAVEF